MLALARFRGELYAGGFFTEAGGKPIPSLARWNGSEWLKEPTSSVDPINNVVSATPSHFSLWAVLGETNRVFLPLVMRNH